MTKLNATDGAIDYAGEHGLDVRKIVGSGKRGKVIVKDVHQLITGDKEFQARRASVNLDEIGSLGLEASSGILSQAYIANLNWPGVFPLYNRIRRSDPEIAIIRQIFGALASKISVEFIPSSENPDTVELNAVDFANEVLEDIEGGISKFIQTMVAYVPFLGFGWWERVLGIRDPNWNPGNDEVWRSQFSDGLIGIRRLAWRDHSTFEKWDMNDATGIVTGFVQSDQPNASVIIPKDRSIHVVYGDNISPEGLAGLEPIYRLERFKYQLEIILGIGLEHAAGHAKFDVERTPSDADRSAIRKAAKALLSGQAGNYVLLPEHIKGAIVDVPFSAATALLEAIKYFGILKLQTFLMHWVTLSATTGAGSFAAMSDASAMFMTVFNSMMQGLIDQVDRQLTKPLFEINAMAFPGLEKLPKLVVTTTARKLSLEGLAQFYNAIEGVFQMGIDDELIARKNSEGLLSELSADQQNENAGLEPPEEEEPEAEIPEEEEENIEEDEDESQEEFRAKLIATFEQGKNAKGEFQISRSYPAIRKKYLQEITVSILDYFQTEDVRITKFKNQMRTTVAEGFVGAFLAGYFTGPNKEIFPEDQRWLGTRQRNELGFVDLAWARFSELKRFDDLSGTEIQEIADKTADGFTKTLDGIFLEAKMRGNRNIGLTFSGEAGEDSCKTCIKWDGKRHRASFWLKRGLVPGQPGNANFECGGFRCEHVLRDDQGQDFLGF